MQNGIGHSPEEVTAALSSTEKRMVADMRETMKKFQLFLAKFEVVLFRDNLNLIFSHVLYFLLYIFRKFATLSINNWQPPVELLFHLVSMQPFFFFKYFYWSSYLFLTSHIDVACGRNPCLRRWKISCKIKLGYYYQK